MLPQLFVAQLSSLQRYLRSAGYHSERAKQLVPGRQGSRLVGTTYLPPPPALQSMGAFTGAPLQAAVQSQEPQAEGEISLEESGGLFHKTQHVRPRNSLSSFSDDSVPQGPVRGQGQRITVKTDATVREVWQSQAAGDETRSITAVYWNSDRHNCLVATLGPRALGSWSCS